MGDDALGLRPQPNTPGYPSGTKHIGASALTRDRKPGHMHPTKLPACGLGQIHPGTHGSGRPPHFGFCYTGELLLRPAQNIFVVAWLGRHSLVKRRFLANQHGQLGTNIAPGGENIFVFGLSDQKDFFRGFSPDCRTFSILPGSMREAMWASSFLFATLF